MKVSLSGNDTFILQERVITDTPDGDWAVLTFDSDLVNAKKGKNGNVIFNVNETGKLSKVVLRVLVGSDDDKFYNNLHSQFKSNPAGFIALSGEMIKKVGDGAGNITTISYVLQFGVFSKEIDAKSNSEGDTEQSVAVYTMLFGQAPRVIG